MKICRHFLALLAAVALLSGCGGQAPANTTAAPSVPTTSPQPQHLFSTQDFSNPALEAIAGEISHSTQIPEAFLAPTSPEIRGRIESVTYQTRAYAYETYFSDILQGRELPVEKTMYVYLPRDYDPETRYPVLYLIHGGHEVAEYWFSMETEKEDDGPPGQGAIPRLLDNLIDQGVIQPMIVVTPALYVETEGYHPYPEGDLDQRHLQDPEPNDPESVCSNKDTLWTDCFATELRQDIIPTIDALYSTCADREHRGIAGTSMGGMTTIRAGLWQCNDLFAWYAPMSSGVTAQTQESEILRQTEALWAGMGASGTLQPISMLLNFNGTKDLSHGSHLSCMEHLVQCSDGSLVNGENYAFFLIDPLEHNFDAWRYTLYLTLQVFFQS